MEKIMNNASRIGLIITVMLMSPFIGAAELDDAQKRNYDQAISTVIRLDPNNARIYIARGMTYDVKGDAESALSDCNKSLELQLDDPDTLDTRGLAHFALGNYQGALKDYSRTIQLDSAAYLIVRPF